MSAFSTLFESVMHPSDGGTGPVLVAKWTLLLALAWLAQRGAGRPQSPLAGRPLARGHSGRWADRGAGDVHADREPADRFADARATGCRRAT